jgi:probable phosphoglycerate mutase
MASLTLVHLVRHGESAGNVNPALRRSEDPALTERGREQAARAAAAVARRGVDAILHSPLRRARETAEAIGAACGLPVAPVQGFHEVDMGSLAEAETPQARAERERIFQAWLAGDRGRGFPAGEDFEAVVRRVRAALAALVVQASGRIAIVTHRMPIAAAAALCEPGGAAVVPGGCANGSVTTLEPLEGGRWRLVAWGETA